MDAHLTAAFDAAKAGFDAGNLPVGAVVVKDGAVIGSGYNRQHETGDPTTHAELEAIRDAAQRAPQRDPFELFQDAICVTTMMPCPMCAGAVIRFGFSRVLVAEVHSYADAGTQPLMERQGIVVEVGREQSCIDLVESYYESSPETAKLMRSGARGKLVL